MLMKEFFLDAARFGRIDLEQIGDVGPHPHIDARKDICRRRIQRVVEIKYPGVDMVERSEHALALKRRCARWQRFMIRWRRAQPKLHAPDHC